MFRITFDGSGILTLVRACTTEYVAMLINGSAAQFVLNSPQVFMVATTKCDSTEVDESLVCRIPVIHLAAAVQEGELRVVCSGDEITLTVVNGGGQIYYETSVVRQVFPIAEIQERLGILSKAKDGYKFNASNLETLFRLTGNMGGFVNLDKGVACAVLGNNRVHVYKRVETPIRMALGYTAYKHLVAVSKEWCSYQNFVISSNSSITVMVTKRAVNTELSYEFVKESGYKYKCKADLVKIARFINQFKITAASVVIDSLMSVCRFESGRQKYVVPVTMDAVKCADNVTVKELVIPTTILTKVITNMPDCMSSIKLKRNFVCIENGDYTIAF